jgi:MFS family permease
LVQRTGASHTAIAFSAALGAAIFALLPTGLLPLALCAIFGLAIGGPAGAIMALPARVLSPPHRAGGFGVFYTIYYAFMAFGPAIAGMLRQASGSPAAPLLFGAALFIAILPLQWLYELFAARLRCAAPITQP